MQVSKLKTILSQMSSELEKKKAELEAVKSDLEKITPSDLFTTVTSEDFPPTDLGEGEEVPQEVEQTAKEVKTVEDARTLLEEAKSDIQLVIDNLDALAGQAMEEVNKVSFKRPGEKLASSLKQLASQADAAIKEADEVKRYWSVFASAAAVSTSSLKNPSLKSALETVKDVSKFARAFSRIIEGFRSKSGTAVPPTDADFSGDKTLSKDPASVEVDAWKQGYEEYKKRKAKEESLWNPASSDRLKAVAHIKRASMKKVASPVLIEDTKNMYFYDNNGYLHREGGPAVILGGKGIVKWYSRGKLHREGGPAVIYPDGSAEWWVNGKLTQIRGKDELYPRKVKPSEAKTQSRPEKVTDYVKGVELDYSQPVNFVGVGSDFPIPGKKSHRIFSRLRRRAQEEEPTVPDKGSIVEDFASYLSDEMGLEDLSTDSFTALFESISDEVEPSAVLDALIDFAEENLSFDDVKSAIGSVVDSQEINDAVESGEITSFLDLAEALVDHFTEIEETEGEEEAESDAHLLTIATLSELLDNLYVGPPEEEPEEEFEEEEPEEEFEEEEPEEEFEEEEPEEESEEELPDEEKMQRTSSRRRFSSEDYYEKAYGSKEYASKMKSSKGKAKSTPKYAPKYKSVENKKTASPEVIKAKMRRALEVAKKFAAAGSIPFTKQALADKTAELYMMSDKEFKAVEKALESIPVLYPQILKASHIPDSDSGITGNTLQGVRDPFAKAQTTPTPGVASDAAIQKSSSVVPQLTTDSSGLDLSHLFTTTARKLQEKGVTPDKLVLPKYRQ